MLWSCFIAKKFYSIRAWCKSRNRSFFPERRTEKILPVNLTISFFKLSDGFKWSNFLTNCSTVQLLSNLCGYKVSILSFFELCWKCSNLVVMYFSFSKIFSSFFFSPLKFCPNLVENVRTECLSNRIAFSPICFSTKIALLTKCLLITAEIILVRDQWRRTFPTGHAAHRSVGCSRPRVGIWIGWRETMILNRKLRKWLSEKWRWLLAL